MDLATFDPDNATDADTQEAQQALADAGYYHGDIDSLFGPQSQDALRRYREDHPHLTAPVPSTPVAGLSKLQHLILDCLAQYVGLVEIVSNAKWADPHNPGRAAVAEKYRKALLDVGCEAGWAYCISSARAVWKEAYGDAGRAADFAALDKHMSVSVMGSYNALHEAGLTTKTPIVGAILFLEHGQTGEGHAVVVTEVHADHVVCTGANTSPAAGDTAHEREGDGIYAGKVYALDFTPKSTGLWPRGFLNPT